MFEFLAPPQNQPPNHGERSLKPTDLIDTMSLENSTRFLSLWSHIDNLSNAEFNLPFEPDNRSVSHHLQIIVDEFERWMGLLEGDEESLILEHELTQQISKEELKRYWKSAEQRFRAYFLQQSTEQLNRHIEAHNGPVWEVLIHLMMRAEEHHNYICLLYTSPSPRDLSTSRMPSSA